jgi:hypothetical protein
MKMMRRMVLGFAPHVVTLTGGKVVLEARPQIPFQLDRLLVSAHLPSLFVVWRALLFAFAWVRLPWFERREVEYDDDFDDDHDEEEQYKWTFVWLTPARSCAEWFNARRQRGALADVCVVSVQVNETEELAGTIPAVFFSPTQISSPLLFSSTSKGSVIRITLEGKGGPLSVAGLGLAHASDSEHV